MDETTHRIAVASDDVSGLDAGVGQHFGRCRAYTLIDVAGDGSLQVKAVENPFLAGHGPGQVPAFIRDTGAQVLLTGGIGGRAIAAFQAFGIQVSAGHQASVREAVEAWMAGSASGAEPCAGHGPGHGPGSGHGQDPHHGRDCGGGA